MTHSPDQPNAVYRDYGLLGPKLLEVYKRIGKDVLPTDLADIIDENPELVDERIRDFVLRGLRGKLKKKRGAKRTSQQRLLEMYVEALFVYLQPLLKARRERQRLKGIKKLRGFFSPTELAHSVIATRSRGVFGGDMSREGVRNLLSSLKKRRNSE